MARYQLERGPIPLHHQVYVDLKSALEDGEWLPGHRLPTERELASRYGCSLITIRRALGELAREERINRTPGRGTFVLEPRIERNLHAEMSFPEEIASRGLAPSTRLVVARLERAGEAIANALGLAPGDATVYLERLRMAGGIPLLLEQVHLSADRFPGLLQVDLEGQSLYDVLFERYATRIVRARETFEPVLLRTAEARLLQQRPRSPALLVEGLAFGADETAIELARTYVRGDRTRYYIERSVVRSGWDGRDR